MKQLNFEVITKIFLLLAILSTPIRYALKSQENKHKIEQLRVECDSLNKDISVILRDIIFYTNETEKMRAEISFMRTQVDKSVQ